MRSALQSVEEESWAASGLEHLASCNLNENELGTEISILIKSEL